jgi:hypothetical protein
MPADPAADASSWFLSADPGADLGESDYEAIHAAIVATEEGRWFLAQYACRNLDADTAQGPAAIDRAEAEGEPERRASEVPMPAPDASPSGPDIARLSRDLGEFADALARAQADVAAITPPGAATERPSILAASEALQELAWFMRERGMDPHYCDRIDGCAGDIAAACAIPDLTAQRTRAIIDMLGNLENRLQVIRAALDGGIRGEDQFGDLGTLPAANANSPAAPMPMAIEAETIEAETIEAEAIQTETVRAEMIQAETIEAKTIQAEMVEAKTIQAEVAAFASDPLAEIEPAALGIDAEITAPASAEAVPIAAPASPAEEPYLYFDNQPAAADSAGTQSSPRLSHLLMAAELDRLLDAQAAAGTGASCPPVREQVELAAEAAASVTVPIEAVASDRAIASDQVIVPEPPEAAVVVETTAPVAETTPVEAEQPQAASSEMQSSSSETAIASAPLAPEPAAPPPRRIAEIPKDAFADVMALSEAERIALFG